MHTLIILQARIGSKRLYGKVLKKINNIPLVVLCAKRLSNTKIPLIVAIPNNKSNIKLKTLLKKNLIKYSLGSHNNVFSRFKNIIEKLEDDTIIIRATADNPLPDGVFVKKILKIFKKFKLDYLDTTKKNFFFPYGLAIQIFKAKLFKRVSLMKLNKYEKEHVVPKISKIKEIKTYKRNFTKYKKFNFDGKFSIDTNKDFLTLKKIFKITKKPISESWTILLNKYFNEK